MPSAYVMGFPVNEENAKAFAAPEKWGFEPPSWKGLTAAHMVLAADRGEIDVLWQSGGNFKSTLPEPELVNRALGKIKLRVHQDIVANPTMFVEPAGHRRAAALAHPLRAARRRNRDQHRTAR